MVTDNSKGTKFKIWCDKCKQEVKMVVMSQRAKAPVCCPFCKGDALVESIETFPRANY